MVFKLPKPPNNPSFKSAPTTSNLALLATQTKKPSTPPASKPNNDSPTSSATRAPLSTASQASTPQYGTALRDHAKDVVELLTNNPLVIKDDVLGTLDTTALAQYLSAPLVAFSAALETVSKEEQELLNALNARDTALNALDLLAQAAHGLASILAHLSNRDDLRAAFLRLKPSVSSPTDTPETDMMKRKKKT